MNYQALRQARKAAKKTQDDLAAHLGVNRATISKYETGIIEPSLTQLQRIAVFLDTDFYGLLDTDTATAYSSGYEDGLDAGAFFERCDNDRKTQEKIKILKHAGYTFSSDEIDLICAFSHLNESGQTKAVERVEELTEIPKYQKEKPPQD